MPLVHQKQIALVLEKVNSIDTASHPQHENASQSRRRRKLTHPIVSDDVTTSRRRQHKETAFIPFTNALSGGKSLARSRSTCRSQPQDRYAHAHYSNKLSHWFLLWRGGEV
jgi:hypothetical protein